MKQEITCPVSRNYLITATSLSPCGHSFSDFVCYNINKCPLCRTVIDSRIPNYALRAITNQYLLDNGVDSDIALSVSEFEMIEGITCRKVFLYIIHKMTILLFVSSLFSTCLFTDEVLIWVVGFYLNVSSSFILKTMMDRFQILPNSLDGIILYNIYYWIFMCSNVFLSLLILIVVFIPFEIFWIIDNYF